MTTRAKLAIRHRNCTEYWYLKPILTVVFQCTYAFCKGWYNAFDKSNVSENRCYVEEVTRNTTNTHSLQYVVYLNNYRFTLRKHRQSITKYICCPERKAMPDSYKQVMFLHPKQAICLESETYFPLIPGAKICPPPLPLRSPPREWWRLKLNAFSPVSTDRVRRKTFSFTQIYWYSATCHALTS